MTRNIYSDLNEIKFQNALEKKYYNGFVATNEKYKFRLTDHIVKLINDTNSEGLKKQFLPDENELIVRENEFFDVADEKNFNPVTGIIHRYPQKVLLNVTLNCPTYCRFCFRKERLNDSLQPKFLTEKQIEEAFKYINNKGIKEVIFSGGDPFFCNDEKIERLVGYLKDLPMVKIVRYHTRYFTFDPKRITNKLASIVKSRQAAFIVMHVNQPEEITPEFSAAAKICVENGIPLFSQTALLKGVNDSSEKLGMLFESLIYNRITPYYLFHSDPGIGLDHFRVKLSEGVKIYNSLYDRISGLAMPIYLFNIPGGYGHSIIDLGNLRRLSENQYELTTWNGSKVIYND